MRTRAHLSLSDLLYGMSKLYNISILFLILQLIVVRAGGCKMVEMNHLHKTILKESKYSPVQAIAYNQPHLPSSDRFLLHNDKPVQTGLAYPMV